MQEVYEELKRQTDENKVSIVEIQKDLQKQLLIVKNFTSKIIEKEKGKYYFTFYAEWSKILKNNF